MTIKKVLPFIIIAIVFVVGGYFIGKAGHAKDQAGAIYGATATQMKASATGTVLNPCDQSPTNPCPNNGGLANNGGPQETWMSATVDGNCWIFNSQGAWIDTIIGFSCAFRVDPSTKSNIQLIQKKYNLPQTGVFNVSTMNKIHVMSGAVTKTY